MVAHTHSQIAKAATCATAECCHAIIVIKSLNSRPAFFSSSSSFVLLPPPDASHSFTQSKLTLVLQHNLHFFLSPASDGQSTSAIKQTTGCGMNVLSIPLDRIPISICSQIYLLFRTFVVGGTKDADSRNVSLVN